MTILESTSQYEMWLSVFTALEQSDLDYKHDQMANREDAFPYFRGTYYRWAQLWPTLCSSLAAGPQVLAVGDLHIENFGTWRDCDGRLCLGGQRFR